MPYSILNTRRHSLGFVFSKRLRCEYTIVQCLLCYLKNNPAQSVLLRLMLERTGTVSAHCLWLWRHHIQDFQHIFTHLIRWELLSSWDIRPCVSITKMISMMSKISTYVTRRHCSRLRHISKGRAQSWKVWQSMYGQLIAAYDISLEIWTGSNESLVYRAQAWGPGGRPELLVRVQHDVVRPLASYFAPHRRSHPTLIRNLRCHCFAIGLCSCLYYLHKYRVMIHIINGQGTSSQFSQVQ